MLLSCRRRCRRRRRRRRRRRSFSSLVNLRSVRVMLQSCWGSVRSIRVMSGSVKVCQGL